MSTCVSIGLAFHVDISKLKIVQKGGDTKLVPCVKHKQTWKLIGGQSWSADWRNSSDNAKEKPIN